LNILVGFDFLECSGQRTEESGKKVATAAALVVIFDFCFV